MSDDAGRTVAPDPLFQLGALLVAAPAADQEVMVRGGSLTRVLLRQETIEDRIRRASWHRRTESRAVTATIWPSALRVCSTAGCWPSTRCSNGELIAVVVEPRRSRLVRLGPAAAAPDQVRTLFFALRRMTQPLPESSLVAARLSADLSADLRCPSCARCCSTRCGCATSASW